VAEVARTAGTGAVSRETLRREWGVPRSRCGDRAGRDRAKYAGYIDKQNDEVERAATSNTLVLPADLDYAQVTALSFEVRQKLSRHRPATLGQASRMSGMTPAAISLLLVHLKKHKGRHLPTQGEAA
jgi:tRNA uridine 5-carboxymethylaminomethyl modification enzyme